jgi:hypothetical protein
MKSRKIDLLLVMIVLLTVINTSCQAPVPVPVTNENLEVTSFEENITGSTIGRLEMYEVTFTVNREFANPYDSERVEVNAYFLLPDGVEGENGADTVNETGNEDGSGADTGNGTGSKNGTEEGNRVLVPGFWYEGYTRKLVNGIEFLEHNKITGWKVRFTPRQSGQYLFHIEIKDHKKNEKLRFPETGDIEFLCIPSENRGFLEVSSTDNSYLEYENGGLFIGLGHNLCGWEWPGRDNSVAWRGTDNLKGTYEYDEWLEQLAENMANLTQFDFSEGGQLEWTSVSDELPWSGEWGSLKRYNQQVAWKMDYIIQKAEGLNIFFRLALCHWEDFDYEEEGFPDWGWKRNPYNVINGGPVEDASDFFHDTYAMDCFKNKLRYIMARWGYSKNILAFELWNEVDAPAIFWGEGKNFETEKDSILTWHSEMASFIKQMDSNNHLITTSFEDSANYLPVWLLDQIDISTIHRYTFYNEAYKELPYTTVETMKKIISDRKEVIDKPVIIGEFALSPGGDIQRLYDKNGIAFHNQLWSSIMAGAATTAMHWNWGSYIHDYKLYYHYRALALFLEDTDLRNTIPFDNISTRTDELTYMGLKTDAKVYIWIKNTSYTFAHSWAGYVTETVTGKQIEIYEMQNGVYRADFYNTYTGSFVYSEEIPCNNEILIIPVPDFMKDFAVKVFRL